MEEEPRVNVPRKDEEEPRKMYVRKTDIGRYGTIPGCPGCAALGTKTVAAHS